MQVDGTVVSQSPPTSLTSTKLTAQAVQSPIQDSFELVLQKTSTQVKGDKSASVDKSSEPRGDVDRHPVSADKKTDSKEKQEVTQAKDTQKQKVHDDKDDNVKKEDKSSTENNLPFEQVAVQVQQFVPVEEPAPDPTLNSEATNGSVMSTPVASLTNSDDLQTTTVTNAANSAQVVAAAEDLPASPMVNETQTTSDIKPEVLTQTDKLIPESLTEASSSELETDSANKNPSSTSPAEAKTETKDIQISLTESETKAKIEVDKGLTKDSQKIKNAAAKDDAPPDTPNVAANGVSTSTVTGTRVTEPARLAEAPRNEVITQVVDQIDQMVKTNRSSVRMQLYPEELGHIELKIVSTKSGVGVSMIADSASTQEVLKSQMNSLKQNMQQAGIQLSDMNIGQGQTSNKQQLSEERQHFVNQTAYQNSKSSDTDSVAASRLVQLQTSVVDYRI
jgi:flagellar hook-length control protein FliK